MSLIICLIGWFWFILNSVGNLEFGSLFLSSFKGYSSFCVNSVSSFSLMFEVFGAPTSSSFISFVDKELDS